VYTCTELLPLGGYPIAVNKYIIIIINIPPHVLALLGRLPVRNCKFTQYKLLD